MVCQNCPLGSYADEEGSFECKVCPNGTTSSGVPDAVTKCTCLPGFYHPSGLSGAECSECPIGALCRGGSSFPVAQKGFWASDADLLTFLACEPPEACQGGALNECGEGREGRKCAECKLRYFKSGNRCEKCPPGASLILLALVLFAIVIVILLIKSVGGHKSAKTYGGTIGIAIKFFQVLSVIGRSGAVAESVSKTIARR